MLNDEILKQLDSRRSESGFAGWSPFKNKGVTLNYTLDALARARFRAVQKSCEGLAASRRVWSVNEWESPNWKLNAGALRVTGRQRVRARRMEAPGLRANVEIWALDLTDRKLFFFPDRMLLYESSLQEGQRYRAIEYSALEIDFSETGFIEERAPQDAEETGHTWRHVNADGSPSERGGRNPRIPIVACGYLRLAAADYLDLRLQISNASAGLRFARALGFGQTGKTRDHSREPGAEQRSFSRSPHNITVEGARRILGVSPEASKREMVAAYRKLARLFHPDKVATLAAETRAHSEGRMKEVNAAYEILKRHTA